MMSSYIVLSAKKIDVDQIRIKKPMRLNGNGTSTVFNLYYGRGPATTSKKLLVQTPVMVLAQPLISESRGPQEYVQAVMCGHRTAHTGFADSFQTLSDTVFKKIAHLYPDAFKDKARASFVKVETSIDVSAPSELGHPPREITHVRARLKNVRSAVSVFDVDQSQIRHDVLMRNDNVIAIFSIEYVWCAVSSYGFECRLVQLRKVDALPTGNAAIPLFTDPLAADDDEGRERYAGVEHTSSSSSTAATLMQTTMPAVAEMSSKYLKMLKVGVPAKAVLNCMVIDGAISSNQAESDPKLATEAHLRPFLDLHASSSSSVAKHCGGGASLASPSSVRRAPPPPPPRPPPPPPFQKAGGKPTTVRPPPPPPPPPPFVKQATKSSSDGGGGSGGMFAVLSQIARKQFSLRPRDTGVAPVAPCSEGSSPQTKINPNPSLVPTLSDILGAKGRLKSVTTPSPQPSSKYDPHDTFPFLKDIRNNTFRLRSAAAVKDPECRG